MIDAPTARLYNPGVPATPRFAGADTPTGSRRVPETAEIRQTLQRLSDNVQSVFLGKPDVVRRCLIGLLARGHLLIEDVPGVGKTVLARSLARSIDGSFARVQFTPDLLPADIVGVSVYDAKTGGFDFKRGPVFANVVLADEINRTTPRTQSALLEAMNEGQVSMDGLTYDLPEPFLVIATQNPYEFEGTYPLPENQLDRFILRLRVGYPTPEHERRILAEQHGGHPLARLGAVVTGEQVVALQKAASAVRVSDAVYDYILALAAATRNEPALRFGISTRGSLALMKASQAAALLAGRDYVVPDDVKELAVDVLAHRVVARSRFAEAGADPAEKVVRALLVTVPCPA
jgi:MoxR-like ATPase